MHVQGAPEHGTPLVQPGAMAAAQQPMPTYRAILPEQVVADGLLSDARFKAWFLPA